MKNNSNGEIKPGEHHPAADMALRWYFEWRFADVVRYLQVTEAMASTALSGNRMAEICLSTMKRLEHREPVSDRYVLGLCWYLREHFEKGNPSPVSK